MEPLRIAVIGAGMMGRLHLRVAAELPTTRVVAVVDVNPEAERLAWLAHADWLQTLDELDDRQLDAAIVAVPTGDHARVAGALLERGVPVLLEKPIAASVEEARGLIETASRTGVAVRVVPNFADADLSSINLMKRSVVPIEHGSMKPKSPSPSGKSRPVVTSVFTPQRCPGLR